MVERSHHHWLSGYKWAGSLRQETELGIKCRYLMWGIGVLATGLNGTLPLFTFLKMRLSKHFSMWQMEFIFWTHFCSVEFPVLWPQFNCICSYLFGCLKVTGQRTSVALVIEVFLLLPADIVLTKGCYSEPHYTRQLQFGSFEHASSAASEFAFKSLHTGGWIWHSD